MKGWMAYIWQVTFDFNDVFQEKQIMTYHVWNLRMEILSEVDVQGGSESQYDPLFLSTNMYVIFIC